MSPTYEREAEDFFTDLEEEYYQNGAGLKDTLDLSAIYGTYAHLFDRPKVEDLLAKKASKADRFLARFAAFQYLDSSVRSLTEEITNAETQATLEWDGQSTPYRLALTLLATEPDRIRRRELHGRLLAIIAERNPLRADRVARLHEEVRALAFDGYEACCVELLEVDLGTLAGQMADLLAKTDALWRAELDGVLAEGEIPRAEAGIADLRYLLGGPQFDALFPKDRLLPALEATLSGLGIPLAGQPNIHLDTEERPRKSPRAFCCPIRVPTDVRLVIMPRGGREDYNSLLHEAGHALHFANIDADAPFAFRCLGDNSVTESYAFLLNMLVRSPAWLRDVARVEPDPAYLRFGRFYQLYYLRRYAAKLAYERELHAAARPGPALADRYVRVLSDAMAVEIPADSYLSDVDDAFYCACYLRAWVLEVHLRSTLASGFGERWFASKDAGDYLKGLWRPGQQFTADELAQRLGHPGLDVDLLVADLLASPQT